MHTKSRFPATVVAVLALARAGTASAHVTYLDLDAPPVVVSTTFGGTVIVDPCATKTTGCQSSNAFTRFGWRKGTEPTLGDSHQLTTNAEFWKFHLAATAIVTITFTQGEADLDPAFSVYRGLLPAQSHDDTAVDPLNPIDDTTFCAAGSPKDAHALPYTYAAHDGYRDTLGYSTTGGLDVDQCSPVASYVGQFDAFASWSMANADGEWARVTYVASVSATPFTGNDQGAHVDAARVTAVGTAKSLTIVLPAGDYLVAAGGEACADDTAECSLPRLYGTVSYQQQPACVGLEDANPCTTDDCNLTTGGVTHAPVSDGTACGTGLVCSSGACVAACVSGASCSPDAVDPCKTYATTCASSSVSSCAVSGDEPDGTSCGAGQTCRAGECVKKASGGCSTDGDGFPAPVLALTLAVMLVLAARRRPHRR